MRKKVLKRLLAGLLCGMMVFTDISVEQVVYAAMNQEAADDNTGNPSGNPEDPSDQTEEEEDQETDIPGDGDIEESGGSKEEDGVEEQEPSGTDGKEPSNQEPSEEDPIAGVIKGEEQTGTTEEENVGSPAEDVLEEAPAEQSADQIEREWNGQVWSGEAAEGIEKGSGKESDPYQISTAEELAYFALHCGSSSSYYQLTSDIYLNESLDGENLKKWTPVGKTSAFRGFFDGNGHTVYNLYTREDADNYLSAYSGMGLFYASYGTIQNLIICNARMEYDYTDTPKMSTLIVNNYGTISNCRVTGTVSWEILQSSNSAACISGMVYSNSSSATVKDCTMQADLTGTIGEKGGSIGGILYSNAGTVTACANEGAFHVESAKATIGGIVYSNKGLVEQCRFGSGSLESSEEGQARLVLSSAESVSNRQNTWCAGGIVHTNTGTISSCKNYGIISAYGQVGGIAAKSNAGTIEACDNYGQLEGYGIYGIVVIMDDSSGDSYLGRCVNYADLSVSHRYGTVAGIVKEMNHGRNTDREVRVEGCVNRGNLSGETVCGIAAESEVYAGASVWMLDCSNEGTLTGMKGDEEYGSEGSAYGIIGSIGSTRSYSGMTRLIRCMNTGEITANDKVAGIAGSLAYGQIEDCYNTGTLDGRDVGGIVYETGTVGSLEKNLIIRCYNEGVLSGSEVGGIIKSMTGGTISCCYNIGSIIRNAKNGSAGNVGGLVGNAQNYNMDIRIENSFNCGNITGVGNSGSSAGGIAGRLSAYNGNISVASCYNIGELSDASQGGAVFGSLSGSGFTIEGIHYLDNTAGSAGWASGGIDLSGCHRHTSSEMQDKSVYEGWDFDTVWSRGNRRYVYPLLQGVKRIDQDGPWKDTNIFKGYVIAVVDKDTREPVKKAMVRIGDQGYYTGDDGILLYTGSEYEYKDVAVTGRGYESVYMDLFTPDAEKRNVIELERKVEIHVEVPDVNAQITMESNTEAEGKSINWLFFDKFKVNITKSIENGDRSTILPVSIERENAEVEYVGADGTIQKRNEPTYKVVFGIKEKEEEDEEGDATGVINTGMYEKMENLFYGAMNTDAGIGLNSLMDALSLEGEVGISITSQILGFCKVKLDENKKLQLLEGGALVGMEGEGEITYRPVYGGGAFYAKAALTLSGDATLTLKFEDESLAMEATINLEQALKIAAGVGTSSTHVELGAEGSLSESITIPFKSAEESIAVDVEANVYLEAKAFGLVGGSANKKVTGNIWPHITEWFPQSRSVPFAGTFTLNDLEPADRDYLTSSARRVRAASDSGIDSENIYPDGTPQMVRLPDGRMLAVWVTDFGNKPAENRTTLVYSIKGSSGWSAPAAVCETEGGDYYPSLSESGGQVSLVWINIGKLEADATNQQIVANTDIWYAEFENDQFSSPVQITEPQNGKMELEAKVASDGNRKAVVWLENSANDPFLEEGTNSLCVRECESGVWGDARCLAEELGAVYGLDAVYMDGELSTAYIMDLDGTSASTDDAEVFLMQGGKTIRVTADRKADRYVVFSGGSLFWTSDGELMEMKDGQTRTIQSTGISNVDNFRVLVYGDSRELLILRADGFQGELYRSWEEGKGFSEPVPVTDFGKHISDYAAVLDGSRITAMLFETEVREEIPENESGSPYGNTALHVYDGLEASNLQLVSMYIDESEIASGVSLPVLLTLYNGSSHDLTQVQVSLGGEQQSVECEIKAGETGQIRTEYVPVSPISQHTLTVTVEPTGYADSNMEDNTLSETVGHGDLALRDTMIQLRADGAAELTGKAVNQGYGAVDSVRLEFWEAEEHMAAGEESSNVPIETNQIGSMAAGAEQDICISIPASYLDFSDAYDGKYFYLKASSSSEESRYDNNSKIVVVFPTAVTGITLVPESMTIPVKGSGKLQAEVVPAGAMNKKIYYTTTDAGVAAVLDDGTVIGVEPGEAVITAITSDGGYTASCTVTVTERTEEEAQPEFTLSDANLSLEKGASHTLEVQNSDGGTVTGAVVWSSTDESVAAVEGAGGSAQITAVSAGTAYIQVSVGDFHDVCLVEVTDSSLQAVILGQSSLELEEGGSAVLTVACVPESAAGSAELIWSSSDESVVSVSEDGQVTAVSGGQATITVVADGSEEIRAECRVTVSAIPRYTLTFDDDLGNSPEEVSGIKEGETAAGLFPAEPVKTGYHFSGWFTEKNGGGRQFTGETKVWENQTLYAFWTLGQWYEGYVVEDIPAQMYTGSAVKPLPVVMDGNLLLVKDVDYTVTWKNNIKAGTGQAVVKGKGNYTGTMTIDFTILPGELSEENGAEVTAADARYTGKALKPTVTVRYGTKTLKNGTDYTISYENNISAGEKDSVNPPTVVITGKGNYQGTMMQTFRIYEKAISGCVIDAIPSQVFSEGPAEPKLTVRTSKNGPELTEGTDYTVRYENNTKIGTAKAIVEGKGAYGGTKTAAFRIAAKSIASADVTITVQEKNTYTAGGVKAPVTVKDGTTILTEGKDYTLSYKNHTSAASADAKKAPTVTIRGKGNYTGSLSRTFTIEQRDLGSDAGNVVTVTVKDIKRTGKALKPAVTVKDGSRTLRNGVDYTVSYVNNKEAGDAGSDQPPTAVISGKGNYTGTLEQAFRIYEKEISSCAVDAIPRQEYSGEEITPAITVHTKKGSEEILKPGVDYSIVYKNNMKSGTGQAVITGLGTTYGGTKTVTFQIGKRSLQAEGIRAVLTDSESGYSYTGSAWKPEVAVTDNGLLLQPNVDYTIRYANSVNAASADSKKAPTVTITGKGSYSGSRSVTFTIEARELSAGSGITVTVPDVLQPEKSRGKEMKPAVTVKDGKKTLRKGTDYTITYENNKMPVGTDSDQLPTAVITGKGNYTGSLRQTFRIYEKAVSSLVVGAVSAQEYDGESVEPELEVRAAKKGALLEAGTDYQVSYTNNDRVGTGKATITGLGSYGGTKTVTFKITKKNLKGAEIQLAWGRRPFYNTSPVYTGSLLWPSDITVTDRGKTLRQGTDYTISCSNNTNAATGDSKKPPTVTIKGKGNYTGSASCTFTIQPLDLQTSDVQITVSDMCYKGTALKPAVTVTIPETWQDKTLKNGVDYTVTYINNTEPGEADGANPPMVIITGKGNYSGEIRQTFRIYQTSISSAYVENVGNLVYTGEAQEPKLTIREARNSEETLKEGVDYVVDYESNVNVGTGKIVITGIGKYGGSRTIKFLILPRWLKWLS